MKVSKIIHFVKRYVLRHPIYVCVYGFSYFLKGFRFATHLYSEQEVITLLREGKSFIRLGDGEVNLMLSLNNHYHTFSPVLKNMMDEIVRDYSLESSYILSVPRFITLSNTELKMLGSFNVWLPLKVLFLLKFPKKVSYMDSHNLYYDGYFERVVAPIFTEKTVIIITNKKTIDTQSKNANFPWKNIRYIETPEDNALGAYNSISAAIDAELVGKDPKQVVLFFAFGPVAKYMLKHYSERGYQGLDIGKVTEVMFTGESIEWMI